MTGRLEMLIVETGNHRSSLEYKRFEVGCVEIKVPVGYPCRHGS